MFEGLEKKYLAEWRQGKYWSQSELAEQAGVHRSIISKIEKGDQVGRFKTAVKIAEVLGIKPEQILEFEPLFEVKKEGPQPAVNQLGVLGTAVGVPAPAAASLV